MRKLYLSLIVLILILALLLSGCNKKEEVEAPVVTPPIENPNEEVVEETVIEEFVEILDKEETDKIISFIDSNLDRLSELEGNIVIDALERKLQNNIEAMTDKIIDLDKDNELLAIDGAKFTFSEESIEQIKNEELKAEVEKSYNNMYKLVNLEGQFYPIIDYSKLQKYNDYLTPEWIDYLDIMAMDSDDLPLSDGSLRISFDELAKRLLATENYLNSYVEGQRQKEVLGLYENKINVYLKGVPNTPIADRDSNIIGEEVLSSYEETANIENYMTSHIIFKYLEFIKGNENIIDEDVLNEADRLIKEVMEILTEFK